MEALIDAIYCNSVITVNKLLPNITDVDSVTKLLIRYIECNVSIAIRSPAEIEIGKLLISRVKELGGINKSLLLHNAILNYDEITAKELITNGIDTSIKDDYGYTAKELCMIMHTIDSRNKRAIVLSIFKFI